jgi:hypothetical protein
MTIALPAHADIDYTGSFRKLPAEKSNSVEFYDGRGPFLRKELGRAIFLVSDLLVFSGDWLYSGANDEGVAR